MTVITRATVLEAAATAVLPDGYRIEVRVQRSFKYRDQWAVVLFKGDKEVSGVATYDPLERIKRYTRTAWAEATPERVTVTTEDGWIKSIEDEDA